VTPLRAWRERRRVERARRDWDYRAQRIRGDWAMRELFAMARTGVVPPDSRANCDAHIVATIGERP